MAPHNDKSTVVQVMDWCHQATSHYLTWANVVPDLFQHMTSLDQPELTSGILTTELMLPFLALKLPWSYMNTKSIRKIKKMHFSQLSSCSLDNIGLGILLSLCYFLLPWAVGSMELLSPSCYMYFFILTCFDVMKIFCCFSPFAVITDMV